MNNCSVLVYQMNYSVPTIHTNHHRNVIEQPVVFTHLMQCILLFNGGFKHDSAEAESIHLAQEITTPFKYCKYFTKTIYLMLCVRVVGVM